MDPVKAFFTMFAVTTIPITNLLFGAVTLLLASKPVVPRNTRITRARILLTRAVTE